MTRFVSSPARCLHHVPSTLSLRDAALTEPCCVAYNAVVKNGAIEPGDQVAVIGPGPIGILCAAMARLQGADVTLIGLPADAHRLAIAARAYGVATIAGDVAALKAQGDGYGVDVVIDAAGVSAALKIALDLVRPAGTIVKVGWGPQPLNLSLDPLVLKNVTLQGSFSHNWPIWEKVIHLLATRRLVLDEVIGGIWPLAEWSAAFNEMQSGNVIKAIVRPDTQLD
jgi:alcohol dehydrogenase/L-iditol 2-dehydrogenase